MTTTTNFSNCNDPLYTFKNVFAPPPRADYPLRAIAFKTLLQNLPYRMLLLKNLNVEELQNYIEQEIRKIEDVTIMHGTKKSS